MPELNNLKMGCGSTVCSAGVQEWDWGLVPLLGRLPSLRDGIRLDYRLHFERSL